MRVLVLAELVVNLVELVVLVPLVQALALALLVQLLLALTLTVLQQLLVALALAKLVLSLVALSELLWLVFVLGVLVQVVPVRLGLAVRLALAVLLGLEGGESFKVLLLGSQRRSPKVVQKGQVRRVRVLRRLRAVRAGG